MDYGQHKNIQAKPFTQALTDGLYPLDDDDALIIRSESAAITHQAEAQAAAAAAVAFGF